ncbi:MAG: murein biosynthesis integral membrane protein MurJ [Chloroflexia bacterium]
MATGRIARAAGIIMVGSILSRMLGLGRVVVISHLFGGGAQVDAFNTASQVSTIIYDLLISGMVSAALVPVLSEYVASDRRAEMGRILGIIMTGAVLVLLVSIGALELGAGPLVHYITNCSIPCPATEALALDMTRVALPGVLFLGMSAVLTAALYSLHRFVYTSLSMSSLNVAIIVAALVLAGLLGVQSLALGLLIGAVLTVAVQWPGLRDLRIRPSFDFGHPAVRRILILYAPIAVSLVASQIALVIDRRWAFEAGEGSVASMGFATTLIQFGLGLVGAAISLAALPSLSQHFANRNEAAYRRTLATGIRLVTVLVLPVTAGLLALSVPLITLVFRHGQFTESDKWRTVLALVCYVPGLPGAALNQVLIFGFYSRKNTLIPVSVGIAGVGVYLVTALVLKGSYGMAGLVLANSTQLTFNAAVTGLLLWRGLGGLPGLGIGSTALKAGIGSVVMGGLSLGVWLLLRGMLPDTSLPARVIALAVPGAVGLLAYVAALHYLKVGELATVSGMIARRLPGRLRQPVSARQDIALDDEIAALGVESPSSGLEARLVSVDLSGDEEEG